MNLKEQLEDPVYKAWFSTPPREKQTATRTPPWVVYAQKDVDGPWRRAEFASWKKGHAWVMDHLADYADMALSHRRQQFQPPVVREGGKRRYHLPPALSFIWCGYCRRMTRFAYFARHHAFGGRKMGVNRGDRRCSICGVRLEAIRRY